MKIWLAGAGVSYDVNWLYVDDLEIGAVGDDRNKKLTSELELDKGSHTVQWILTGGTFRGNILIIQDAAGKTLPLTIREGDMKLLKDRNLHQLSPTLMFFCNQTKEIVRRTSKSVER